MKKKYTRGPWKVKHSESKTAFNVIGTRLGERYKIARCPYYYNDKTDYDFINEEEKREAEANAHLIAAAPKLLEALQILLKEYNDHDVQMRTPIAYGKGFQMAEDAIAKALNQKEVQP